MGHPTKIATCCHCGSKAALTLDQSRHELACASCGAPLHDLKMLPRERTERAAPKRKRAPVDHRRDVRHFPSDPRAEAARQRKPRKLKKRRKSWLKDLAEDAFDLIEDIFD